MNVGALGNPLSAWWLGGGRAGRWALVCVVGFLLLYDLGGRSLHLFDTARWGHLTSETLASGSWLVPQRDGEIYANKPPLYLWLVALPSHAFGAVEPLFVRLPSALGFFLLLFATERWARLRLGSRRTARLAALLVLGNPALFHLAREGRPDMLGAGLSVMAAWTWDALATEQRGRRAAWIVGLLLGLALLVKGPPLLIVPVVAWLLPVAGASWRARWRAGRPLLVLAAMTSVALLWFVPAVMSAGWETYGRGLLFDQTADRLAGTSTHVEHVGWYLFEIPLLMAPFGAAYLLVGFLAFLSVSRSLLGRAREPALGFMLALALFSLVPTKHMRYLPPLVPLAAMSLAHVWLRLLARDRRGCTLAPWITRVGGALVVASSVAAVFASLNARHGEPWPVWPLAGLAAACGTVLLFAPLQRGLESSRRAVSSFVLAIPLLLATGLALRSRLATTDKESFVVALVQASRPGDRLALLHGANRESVFHARTPADVAEGPEGIPWASHPNGWIVVGDPDRLAAVETLTGRRMEVIVRVPGVRHVAARLEAQRATR